MQFSLLALNLARCKQINRSINAHFVLTPIRYQQLHIYIHVCVCQCVVYGIHDSPSVHTLVAHATFGACYHKIQRDMSTACGAKKNCCTWAKQRTQKRRTSNTAAKVLTTFNNNNQQQQQQQLQLNYVLCFVRCFVVDLCLSLFAQCGPNIDSLGALLADNQMCIFLQLCVTVRVRSTWIESVPLSVHVCVSVCVCGFNCCDYYIYRNVRTGTSSYSNKLND